jgi:hypothetical protein
MCLHHPSVGRGTGKNTAPSTITEKHDHGGRRRLRPGPSPSPPPKKNKNTLVRELDTGISALGRPAAVPGLKLS